jgi:hypothetical protein
MATDPGARPQCCYSGAVSDGNQYSLLGQRRFAPFFLTQLLGAFNDNIFRNGLIILITFQGVKVLGMNASQFCRFFFFPLRPGSLRTSTKNRGLFD